MDIEKSTEATQAVDEHLLAMLPHVITLIGHDEALTLYGGFLHGVDAEPDTMQSFRLAYEAAGHVDK
ncbi:hypothetical protein [Parasedimentitalea psychrophila]|uniref:Uncharacterized protein n=1 Tax=Parasedimentitalea psychrophila TaxID=2997337 RepID=A0A9Y2P0D4_9RHOB|nr:hypothetical protein [Parasedimentitalea psychrophila]WIY24496.1 hypothetical protein QPJ95_18390 [Parasedimentitalea psychrophila]